MKTGKFFGVVAGMLASLTLGGCGSPSDGNIADRLDYLAVQQSDGRWGLCAPDGKVEFVGNFDGKPTSVLNGVFSVQKGELFSLYKLDGKPEPIDGASDLLWAGALNDGLIPITRQAERISLIDKNGQTAFFLEPVDGLEISSCHSMFSEGLLIVRNEDGLYGAVDTKGNVIVRKNRHESLKSSRFLLDP